MKGENKIGQAFNAFLAIGSCTLLILNLSNREGGGETKGGRDFIRKDTPTGSRATPANLVIAKLLTNDILDECANGLQLDESTQNRACPNK
jgi:hypothetical protein